MVAENPMSAHRAMFEPLDLAGDGRSAAHRWVLRLAGEVRKGCVAGKAIVDRWTLVATFFVMVD